MFDGHNDTLLKILLDQQGDANTFWTGLPGHIDIHKAKEGGLQGGFFAIFVPNRRKRSQSNTRISVTTRFRSIKRNLPINHKYAREMAIKMITLAHRMNNHASKSFVIVRNVEDLETTVADPTKLACVLHFEGAQPIDPGLELLPLYYEQGLRSIGLVWSRPNAFGTGVPFAYPQSPDVGPGLTQAGLHLVKACNQMGIMVDMAHLNEKGFWDVAKVSEHPLVVTHACVHEICPSARNLTDAQIDAIAESNGVVGMNFFVADVRPDGQINPNTPLSMIVDHIRYIVDRVGIEHVALGSDFDGALMPHALNSAANLPALAQAMTDAGFSPEEVQTITQNNWLRVLRETWH